MSILSKRIVRSALSSAVGLALSLIGIVAIDYLPESLARTDVLFIPVAAAAGVGAAFTTRAHDYWPLAFLALFWTLVFAMGFLYPLVEGHMDVAAKNLIITGGSFIAVVAAFLLVSMARWSGHGA